MKITVAEYAKTRNISDATVKAAINRLELELEQNPNDKRQRLLSLEQQAALDTAIPKANPPSSIPTVPTEVILYQRPTEVGMVIAERAVTVGEITYTPQTATDNPLYLALQQRVESMKAQNAAITQQVNISLTAANDTAAAIDSLKQLEILQEAQSKAYRDFHLKQQAYAAATQQLEMQAAGLTPLPPTHQVAPTRQVITPDSPPKPQSTPF